MRLAQDEAFLDRLRPFCGQAIEGGAGAALVRGQEEGENSDEEKDYISKEERL